MTLMLGISIGILFGFFIAARVCDTLTRESARAGYISIDGRLYQLGRDIGPEGPARL